MWLSIIISFLVVFVIWTESSNVTMPDNDIYKLKAWSRDPKYDVQRKSNVNFRSGRKMEPMRPNFMYKRAGSDNNTWDADVKARRIRVPLKERIHERVHAGEKQRSHRSRDSKKEKDEDDEHHVKSTRITLMQLVKQSTAAPHHGKKETSEEEDKKKVKPLDEGKEEEEESEEPHGKLSVYAMKQSMTDIAKQLGKETNITFDVLGRTFEYNDIVILKMTEIKSEISKFFRTNDDAKYIDEVPEKKIIFIVHALVSMGLQNLPCLTDHKKFMQLLNYYLEHLDKFDIFLMPMANPDGYAKSAFTRNWNKNTSPQTSCQGVNLDRNFDVAWSEAGQVQSCSQHYPGPNAFSEPESRAVREVLHRYSHKIAAYIHVHGGTFTPNTYKGEAVLYPKGFSEVQSDDDKYMDMKGEIDEVMRNASFQRSMVTVDTLHHWYGKVTGTSVDYAASVFGIPFAMEFVMQTYSDSVYKKAALTAIWKRVIDAVFNFIHKKGESANDV